MRILLEMNRRGWLIQIQVVPAAGIGSAQLARKLLTVMQGSTEFMVVTFVQNLGNLKGLNIFDENPFDSYKENLK